MAIASATSAGGEDDASRKNDPGVADSAAVRESSSVNVAAISKDANVKIPVIDMTAPKEVIAEQMWNAARTVGFFTIINHDILEQDIDAIFALSEEFFDQHPSEKGTVPFDRDRNSGYEYMTQAPASTNTMDQKESMQITAREGAMDGLWPSRPPNFRSDAESLMVKTHALACDVLSLLEPRACPHLVPGTLAGSHHLWGKDGQCTLRLMHYPPLADDDDEAAASNLWRAGAHTDWGCVTLLFQRVGQDGLECLVDPRGDGAWIEVPPVPNGGITVNVGDMLQLWSGGRLVSNMHRVRMPRGRDERRRGRHSVAFFLQADGGAQIDGGGGEGAVSAGEYFAGRIGSHFTG